MPEPLVTPQGLTAHLAAIGQASTPARAQEAAETADAFVRAYCTRGIPDPTPRVVRKVALALATRLAANPTALRNTSAEGQAVTFPPVGFTYLESVLLHRYRRRAA